MPSDEPERLVPLDEVQRLALSGVRSLAPVTVPVDEALGCVLAVDVPAGENVPPFTNTAMDGFAVRAADTAAAPVELEVLGVLGAGSASSVVVGPGQAMQVMTGAPIPEGADAIAIVERTEAVEGPGRHVRVLDPVAAGAHLRRAGSDIAAGSLAVSAGTCLGPAHIGVLASVGAGRVSVVPRPRVGVVITGDELVSLNADGSAPPLRPGQIRESNRHALLATLRSDGFEAIDLGVAVDTEDSVSDVLHNALKSCDAVLTTGGVSKGEFDFVKIVLGRLASTPAAAAAGAGVHLLSVAIRPAKPLVIAWLPPEQESPAGEKLDRLVPVFGLPGNPVSSLVSYRAIALPALRVLAGHEAAPPPVVPAVAATDIRRSPDGKTHLARVQLNWSPDGRLEARPAVAQMSHQLAGMTVSNGLAIVPDGEGFSKGEALRVILFGEIPSATD